MHYVVVVQHYSGIIQYKVCKARACIRLWSGVVLVP